jgi:hypothetical protein
LRPFAAGGAPSAAALAAEFARRIPAMLAASRPPESSGSLADRISGALARFVTVRPVGEPAGDDPPALAARAESALTRAALGDAQAAFARLPEPARAAAGDFGGRLQARAAADQAAQALLAAATRDLARPQP